MFITAFNPETDGLEKSYLADPIAAGVTTCELKNNNRFATNQRIMFGEQGMERTEIVTCSSANANGTTIVHGATEYEHSPDDPVTIMRFDQVKFYRSTTGINGTYSLLTTEDLDVDNADLKTKYDDTTGTSAYYYKISVYHSISGIESTLTDPIPGGTGWGRNQFGYIIDELLQEVSDPSEVHVTRTELIGYFNDVNDELTSNVAKPYDFLRTRTTLDSTASAITLDFPTDSLGNQSMWKFDRMDYFFTDSSTGNESMSTLKVMPEVEFRNDYPKIDVDSTDTSDTPPVAISLDTALNRFRYWHPSTTTLADVFYLYYWKYFDRILTEGQEIETPTPLIYKLYAKWRYYTKQAIDNVAVQTVADNYQRDYLQEKAKYKQLDRTDQGTPRGFRPMSSSQRAYRR